MADIREQHFGMGSSGAAKTKEKTWFQPLLHFLEILLFGAAIFLAYLLHFTAVFPAVSVDFDLTDVTISKPLIPRQNRSISRLSTILYITITPSMMIILAEFILAAITYYHRQATTRTNAKCCASSSIIRVIRFLELHLFGLLLASILCDVIVKTLPSLSPSFLSVCKTEAQDKVMNDDQNLNLIENLTNPSYLMSVRLFQSKDCRHSRSGVDLKDARTEFPSYFVCLATFTSTYMFLYLRFILMHARPALKTTILWTTMTFPYVLGLMEIAEYASHVISVIGGWVLGIAVAILAAREALFIPGEKPNVKFKVKASIKFRGVEANNIFEAASRVTYAPREYGVKEDETGDDDTILSNRDDEEEIRRPKSKIALEIAPSPAISRLSRSTTHTVEDDAKRGFTAERNVIKELQDYMLETDFRGGVESPKPTQIRQRTRGVADGRRQTVLSTFQADPMDKSETNEEVSPSVGTQKVQADVQSGDEQLNLPVIGLPTNFRTHSPCEIKPSSTSEGLEWLGKETNLNLPGTYRPSRPLSYNYLATDDPYNLQVRFQTFSNKAATLDSSTARPLQRELRQRCDDSRFASSLTDGESDATTSEKASSSSSPAVARHNGEVFTQIAESDIVSETSNLLCEVFDLMNEDKGGETYSDDEFRN